MTHCEGVMCEVIRMSNMISIDQMMGHGVLGAVWGKGKC